MLSMRKSIIFQILLGEEFNYWSGFNPQTIQIQTLQTLASNN